MELTLKFDLPEEQDEALVAAKATSFAVVIQELDNHFRSRLKYADLDEDIYAEVERAKAKLWELLNDAGIEDLIW